MQACVRQLLTGPARFGCTSGRRYQSLLVIDPNTGNLNSLTAARQLGKPIDALLVGSDVSKARALLEKAEGLQRIYVAEDAAFAGLFPEVIAPISMYSIRTKRKIQMLISISVRFQVLQLHGQNKYTHILSGASVYGKNLLPRVAASLDVSPLSEVIGIKDADTFSRNVYAGNAIETVRSLDPIKVLTVRETAFEKPAPGSASNTTETVSLPADLDKRVEFESAELSKSERPELGSAARIVSGGRGLKSGDNFKLLYELADKLKAGVGASRAAVDAGFVPNDMQIGQTGKIVAPELYVAVGISGAIQHLAGMKDSKTIVAINKDPDAPIFQVADLGLVEDLFKAVPEINQKIDSYLK